MRRHLHLNGDDLILWIVVLAIAVVAFYVLGDLDQVIRSIK